MTTRTRKQRQYKSKHKKTKKHTDNYSKYQKGGNEIEKQILDTIRSVEQNKNTQTFTLKFKFITYEYETIFTVSYDKEMDSIKLKNNCISHTIDIYKSKKKVNYDLHSFISSNTVDIKCFNPVLQTIEEPIRITTTDVLQTLSTKLKLILKKGGYIKEIEIIDQSKINKIRLLPYRILRGLPALYEKYGYVSKELNEFREKILPNATWNYITSIDSSKKVNKEYFSILEKYNKDLNRKHITDLLKNVPFEEETTGISSRILSVLLMPLKTSNNDSNSKNDSNIIQMIDGFKLNPESPKWQEWNSKLQFISA